MNILMDRIWKKFAWMLTVLVLITLLIFNYFQYYGIKTTLIDELEHEISLTTEMLSLGLSDSLWHYNTTAVERLCESLFADEEIAYVRVVDLDESVLFDKRQSGDAYLNDDIIHKKTFVYYNDKIIATSYFGVTYYYKNQVLNNLIKHSSAFLVLVLIIMILFIYILSKRITRPIRSLAERLEGIVDNKHLGDMEVTSNDEIAGLVRSFNHMRRALEISEVETNKLTSELETLNRELEEKVEIRTGELNALNLELEVSLSTIQETQSELIVKNDRLESTLQTLEATEEELIYNAKRVLTSQLVAGVAHEINTPIGVTLTLSTFLESIVKKIEEAYTQDKLGRAQLEDFLEKLKESSRIMSINLGRASTLIEGFKKVSVNQVDEIQHNFNVKEYFGIIVQSMHPELKKYGTRVTLEITEDLELYTFPGALTQVLTNLMMNSMIHGFEDTFNNHIGVALSLKDTEVIMSYTDNGRGIEESISKSIFDPFFTTKRGKGGSGLGLFIIANIVSSTLNGRINYIHVDEGARFDIIFPLEIAGEVYA